MGEWPEIRIVPGTPTWSIPEPTLQQNFQIHAVPVSFSILDLSLVKEFLSDHGQEAVVPSTRHASST